MAPLARAWLVRAILIMSAVYLSAAALGSQHSDRNTEFRNLVLQIRSANRESIATGTVSRIDWNPSFDILTTLASAGGDRAPIILRNTRIQRDWPAFRADSRWTWELVGRQLAEQQLKVERSSGACVRFYDRKRPLTPLLHETAAVAESFSTGFAAGALSQNRRRQHGEGGQDGERFRFLDNDADSQASQLKEEGAMRDLLPPLLTHGGGTGTFSELHAAWEWAGSNARGDSVGAGPRGGNCNAFVDARRRLLATLDGQAIMRRAAADLVAYATALGCARFRPSRPRGVQRERGQCANARPASSLAGASREARKAGAEDCDACEILFDAESQSAGGFASRLARCLEPILAASSPCYASADGNHNYQQRQQDPATGSPKRTQREGYTYLHQRLAALGQWAVAGTSFPPPASPAASAPPTPTARAGLGADSLCGDMILALGGFGREGTQANAWAGGRGTTAHLHYDSFHNLYAHVLGRKSFRLFPARASLALHVHSSLHPHAYQSQLPADELMQRSFSEGLLQQVRGQLDGGVNASLPLGLTGFPLWASAMSTPDFSGSSNTPAAAPLGLLHASLGAIAGVLEPGDVLYIPPFWWHHVTAESASFSVNVWCPSLEYRLGFQLQSHSPKVVNAEWPAMVRMMIAARWLDRFLSSREITAAETPLPVGKGAGRLDSSLLFMARLALSRHPSLLRLLIPEAVLAAPDVLCSASSARCRPRAVYIADDDDASGLPTACANTVSPLLPPIEQCFRSGSRPGGHSTTDLVLDQLISPASLAFARERLLLVALGKPLRGLEQLTRELHAKGGQVPTPSDQQSPEESVARALRQVCDQRASPERLRQAIAQRSIRSNQHTQGSSPIHPYSALYAEDVVVPLKAVEDIERIINARKLDAVAGKFAGVIASFPPSQLSVAGEVDPAARETIIGDYVERLLVQAVGDDAARFPAFLLGCFGTAIARVHVDSVCTCE